MRSINGPVFNDYNPYQDITRVGPATRYVYRGLNLTKPWSKRDTFQYTSVTRSLLVKPVAQRNHTVLAKSFESRVEGTLLYD